MSYIPEYKRLTLAPYCALINNVYTNSVKPNKMAPGTFGDGAHFRLDVYVIYKIYRIW